MLQSLYKEQLFKKNCFKNNLFKCIKLILIRLLNHHHMRLFDMIILIKSKTKLGKTKAIEFNQLKQIIKNFIYTSINLMMLIKIKLLLIFSKKL